MGEGPLQHVDRYAEHEWVHHLTANQEAKEAAEQAKRVALENSESNVDPKAEARMESQNKIDSLQGEVDTMTEERDELLGSLKALKMMLQGNPADAEQLQADEKAKTVALKELQTNLGVKTTELKRLEAQHRTVFGMQS